MIDHDNGALNGPFIESKITDAIWKLSFLCEDIYYSRGTEQDRINTINNITTDLNVVYKLISNYNNRGDFMKLYEFIDKRDQEYLEIHDLKEAFLHIFNYESDGTEEEMIQQIADAGFVVRDLPEIETLIHSSSINPGVNKIQLSFNNGVNPILADLYVEEHDGRRYLNIDFLTQDSMERSWRRMYDEYGNEKTIELCSHCEKEVVIDAEKKEQTCPECGEKIWPCGMCCHDNNECNQCEVNKNRK